MTRRNIWVGVVMLVLAVGIGPAPAEGQPLATTLLEARRAYVQGGTGIERKWVDRVVREITTYRPQVLALLGDRAEADIVITLSGGAYREGTVVAPISGQVFIVPVDKFVYRLRVHDVRSGVVLWEDSRPVNWLHGGAVADLVKDFLTRVATARQERRDEVDVTVIPLRFPVRPAHVTDKPVSALDSRRCVAWRSPLRPWRRGWPTDQATV